MHICYNTIMSPKNRLKIVSKFSPDYSSNITVNDRTYHVQTEDMGRKNCRLVSRIYLNGEVVHSVDSEYTSILEDPDFENRLIDLMEKQHKDAIDGFATSHVHQEHIRKDYIEELHQLLRRKNTNTAMHTAKNALDAFPDDPFFLSHYGFLLASTHTDSELGVKICADTLARVMSTGSPDHNKLFSVVCINLGRAYLHSGNKPEAMQTLRKGLLRNPGSRDILWEIKKMGIRKKPVIPFLSRDNPVNKYLGKVRNKFRRNRS